MQERVARTPSNELGCRALALKRSGYLLYDVGLEEVLVLAPRVDADPREPVGIG
jgi:hypothetical protein